MDINDEHLLKKYLSIEATVLGIVMDVKDRHQLKYQFQLK
jgi:hypothetical protein